MEKASLPGDREKASSSGDRMHQEAWPVAEEETGTSGGLGVAWMAGRSCSQRVF